MPDKLWKKIIDESRGMGITYRPFLLNEPFTDKRMPEICAYIKEDKTAKIEFNTNAGLLIPQLSDELIKIGIDYMRFSIDGFYKETYEKRRKGLNYEETISNVEYFCKQAKDKNILTEARMIAFPDSEEEQALFIKKWKNITQKTTITSLYRYPWDGQESSIDKPCLKIQDEMFFYVDGTSTLCCWDTDARAIIGDIKTQSVLDIWNGEILKQQRLLLDQGERLKIELCSRCDAYKKLDFTKIRG
jgi:hypothetical protein